MSPTDGRPSTSRRRFLGMAATATVGSAIAGCLDLLRPPVVEIGDGPTVGLETIASGLTYPTDLVQPDDDSERLFVTDQIGEVRVIEDGELRDEPFLDVSDKLVDVGIDAMGGFDERGLLGIEFHPNFSSNDRFFLRYSAPPFGYDTHPDAIHVEVLAEYIADGDSADPQSERIILEISQPQWIHNSGNILFGPEGYLYIPTGDGGSAFEDHDPDWYHGLHRGTGQNTTDNLLGGVLRIDVDSTEGDMAYAIPPDNPLVDVEGHRNEYYAWGFRNPWGASFDGDDLYVADVGQALFETVNLVEKGGNYGWNIREGTHCFDPGDASDPPDECPNETPDGQPLLDPIIEYPQEDNDTQLGSAVIGGHVYRGGAVDGIEGAYVFGDWSADPHGDPLGKLYMARPPREDEEVHGYFEDRDLWPIWSLGVEGEGDIGDDSELNRYVISLGSDLDGAVYVLTGRTPAIEGDTGEIHRIVPVDG